MIKMPTGRLDRLQPLDNSTSMAFVFSAHDTDDSELGVGSTRCDVS